MDEKKMEKAEWKEEKQTKDLEKKTKRNAHYNDLYKLTVNTYHTHA